MEQVSQLAARVTELEKVMGKPPKTPRNSSLPLSRAEKVNKQGGKPKKRRKRGFGAWRGLQNNPDKTIDAYVEGCPHCCNNLMWQKEDLQSVREKIEVKIETHVPHARLFGCKCPECGRRVVADAPERFGKSSPFANSVEALEKWTRNFRQLVKLPLI